MTTDDDARLTVRMRPAEMRALDRLCKRRKIGRSQAVREALLAWAVQPSRAPLGHPGTL